MGKTAKVEVNRDGTQRGLTNLAVQMIAFGGSIGTGLFLGAGSTIHRTGPSILFVYAIIGGFFFLMMRAIGEMLYADPNQHTFVVFIHRYLGSNWGKFAEWSYWLELILAAMAELTAIAAYFQLWFPTLPAWLIQLAFLVGLTLINVAVVSFFGKTEIILSGIKIITILGLIIVGAWLVVTHHQGISGDQATISNLTRNFTLFPNGISQFIFAFPMVFFAFQGMEFVGITTAETKQPRQVLPRAINQIIGRILFFYIGSLAVIMMVSPWQQINASQSPFVQIFELAGIPAAALLINAVVIIAAASTLNSAIFSTGRHLYQLALESNSRWMLPLRKISVKGIPLTSVLFSAALMLGAPILSLFNQLTTAFTFVASVSGDIYSLVCILTMLAHLKFRQKTIGQEVLFRMPAYRITEPLTICFFGAVFVSLFFSSASRWPAIGAIIWALGFAAYLKLGQQNTISRLERDKQ